MTISMASWLISPLNVIFLIGLVSMLICSLVNRKHKIIKKLPPGPRGLPIIGNLHKLGDLPHQDLHRLAKKYGSIMHIKLGQIPTIVVSSPKYAELFLKTHGVVFASRPKLQSANYLTYGQKGVIFAQYGTYWRNMRKLCILELLTSTKIELFRPMRKEEVNNVVRSLKVAADACEAVCLSEKVETVVEDMTYRMLFGSKDNRFQFKPVIDETMKLTGAFNIGDYIPCLAPFDLQGLISRMKIVNKVYDEYLEKIIEEHLTYAKEQHGNFRDFIDVLLSLMESDYTQEIQLDSDNIKAIILDMLAAAMDTSANVTIWAFSELLRHPLVMKKVQEELKNVVGIDRMVEETDLAKLNYLSMVIKETLRLHPIAPLLLPHESTEDITIEGYYIPKKSKILINVWTIGRDPNIWTNDAEEFNPDRFINNNIDVHGQNFELIPFGSGRRGCPGMQLGLILVQLVLAQFLHCFNWKLPDGILPCDLNMDERFGVTSSRVNPVFSIPTYRLHVDNF